MCTGSAVAVIPVPAGELSARISSKDQMAVLISQIEAGSEIPDLNILETGRKRSNGFLVRNTEEILIPVYRKQIDIPDPFRHLTIDRIRKPSVLHKRLDVFQPVSAEDKHRTSGIRHTVLPELIVHFMGRNILYHILSPLLTYS